MKLGQALMERQELTKRKKDLYSRIKNNVKVQEGTEPVENISVLMPQYKAVCAELLTLIKSINHTNAITKFAENETFNDALARREYLKEMMSNISELAKMAVPQQSYTKTEIKWVPAVDVPSLQKQSDQYAKELRILDISIQEANWKTDLIAVS